jgi:hypothetical protein
MLGGLDNRAVALPLLLGTNQGNAIAEPWQPPFLSQERHLSPGTPAWSHFNRRRAELIRRKVRGCLLPSEEKELDWLQKESLAAVDRTFPRPPLDLHYVADLEKRLQEGS